MSVPKPVVEDDVANEASSQLEANTLHSSSDVPADVKTPVTELSLNPSSSTRDAEAEVRASKTKTPQQRPKSMFRRPLAGGPGGRLYVMPPLPPTSTTLAAFKSLLLDRLRLLRIAGKFHIDSVLGIPRELQRELNPEAAAGEAATGNADCGSSPTRAPDLAGRAVSYPQLIRSEFHARHWMHAVRNTHDYQMLRSRFLSLFVWPALLSSVHLDTMDADQHLAPVASLLGSGRLVSEPEPDADTKADAKAVIGTISADTLPRPPYR